MIKIKQEEDKYTIELHNEVWKLPNRKELDALVKQILDLKNKYGRLKREEKIYH